MIKNDNANVCNSYVALLKKDTKFTVKFIIERQLRILMFDVISYQFCRKCEYGEKNILCIL